ncbi:acylphosphatase [Pasteurellaceae bacterium LIM206]|nr:acylphosphatase [Pasteurellaceae bacterium LIM206]
MPKYQFSVYGRVQGVGFRYFTWKKANELKLTGMVRNLANGSVQVIAEGDDIQMEAFRQWLQTGPRTASVKQVIEQPYQGDRVFSGFQVEL